jgi:hypothetical protein
MEERFPAVPAMAVDIALAASKQPWHDRSFLESKLATPASSSLITDILKLGESVSKTLEGQLSIRTSSTAPTKSTQMQAMTEA